jgi:hypothetical protein
MLPNYFEIKRRFRWKKVKQIFWTDFCFDQYSSDVPTLFHWVNFNNLLFRSLDATRGELISSFLRKWISGYFSDRKWISNRCAIRSLKCFFDRFQLLWGRSQTTSLRLSPDFLICMTFHSKILLFIHNWRNVLQWSCWSRSWQITWLASCRMHQYWKRRSFSKIDSATNNS